MSREDMLMREIDKIYEKIGRISGLCREARARLSDANDAWYARKYDTAENLLEETRWKLDSMEEELRLR